MIYFNVIFFLFGVGLCMSGCGENVIDNGGRPKLCNFLKVGFQTMGLIPQFPYSWSAMHLYNIARLNFSLSFPCNQWYHVLTKSYSHTKVSEFA